MITGNFYVSGQGIRLVLSGRRLHRWSGTTVFLVNNEMLGRSGGARISRKISSRRDCTGINLGLAFRFVILEKTKSSTVVHL